MKNPNAKTILYFFELKRLQKVFLLITILVLPACKPPKQPVVTEPVYVHQVDSFFVRRYTKRLPSETGWLNLAGLHWLKNGENTFGSDSSNTILFPKAAPSKAGVITLKEGRIYLKASADIFVEGKKVKEMELFTDRDSNWTQILMGRYKFAIIKRGQEFAIRLRDLESPLLKSFKGIDRYPVSTEYRVRAKFEPYTPVKIIPIPTVIPNFIDSSKCTGALVFELDGKTYRLDPVIEEGSDDLFVIFGDKTNGKETYGGGRFVYCKVPDSTGYTTLDFNYAYNPPCVFTEFATCPLPPVQNKLPIEILAGEKKWHQ